MRPEETMRRLLKWVLSCQNILSIILSIGWGIVFQLLSGCCFAPSLSFVSHYCYWFIENWKRCLILCMYNQSAKVKWKWKLGNIFEYCVAVDMHINVYNWIRERYRFIVYLKFRYSHFACLLWDFFSA